MGTDRTLFYEALVAFVMAGLIYLAYRVGGFLGVGVLGLLVTGIAFQADRDKSAPSSTGLFSTNRLVDLFDHRDESSRRQEAEFQTTPILVGKLLGMALVTLGFGLFFLL